MLYLYNESPLKERKKKKQEALGETKNGYCTETNWPYIFVRCGFLLRFNPRFMLRVRSFAAVQQKVPLNHQCKHPPLRSLLMLDGAHVKRSRRAAMVAWDCIFRLLFIIQLVQLFPFSHVCKVQKGKALVVNHSFTI